MLGKKSAAALGSIALALSLSLGAASAQAAECKGLDAESCKANDKCTWVDPFLRKDGVKVSGHCRSKPTKSVGKSGDAKKPDTQEKGGGQQEEVKE